MSSSARVHSTVSTNNPSRFPPSPSSSSSCTIHSPHFSFKQTSTLLSDATKPQLNRYLRRHGRGSRANHSKADLHKRAMMLAVCRWRVEGAVLTRESFLGKSEGCGCCRGEGVGRQTNAPGGEEKREDKKVGEGHMGAAGVDTQDSSTMHEGEGNGVDEKERQDDENSSTTTVGYYSDAFTEQFQASTTIKNSSVYQPGTSTLKRSIEKGIVPKEGETSVDNDDDYVEISFETTELCHQPTEVKMHNPEQNGTDPKIKNSDEAECGKKIKLPMLREHWIEISSNPPSVKSLQTSNTSPTTTIPERSDGDIEDDYIITTFNEWFQSAEAPATAEPDLATIAAETTAQTTCNPSGDVAKGSLNLGICRDCKGILDTVICLDDFKDGDDDNDNSRNEDLALLPCQLPKDESTAEEYMNMEDKMLDTSNPKDNMAESESPPEQNKEEASAPVEPTLTASISIDDCIYPGAFPKDSEPDNDDDDIARRT